MSRQPRDRSTGGWALNTRGHGPGALLGRAGRTNLGLLTIAFLGYLLPGQLIIWLHGFGFWPSAGVGVALLLLVPTIRWPWVVAGVATAEVTGSLIGGYALPGIPFWAAANVSEQLLGAYLFRRLAGGAAGLLPLANTLRFLVACVLAGPALGASVGAAGRLLLEDWEPHVAWLSWFAGDALGILVVASVALAWRERPVRRRLAEESAVALALALTALAEFPAWPGGFELLTPYLSQLVLVWAALRLGIRKTTLAMFSLAQFINVITAFDSGAFAGIASSPREATTLLQAFLLIASASTLVLAAMAEQLRDRSQVEDELRQLADSMPQLVWVADEAGRVQHFSRRSDAYLAPELAARPGLRWLSLLHPSDIKPAAAAWSQAARSETPFEQEHRMRLADGSFRWHLTRAEPVRGPAATRWYGTSTDIHDLRLLIELKDEFIAVASHELRNPVAAVHGLAQLLQRRQRRGLLRPADLDRFTSDLVAASSRMARLTSDLMDVSRLQRGTMTLQLERTPVTALVEPFEDTIEWPAARLSIQLPRTPLPLVHVDAHSFRQVLTNLIENAMKYSPPSEPVSLSARAAEGGVVLTVTDHGIGIPPDALDSIFQPFTRASNSGNVQGLGLGLYVSREIIHLHGGRLWAESAGLDRGATMNIWLPLATVPEPASHPPRAVVAPSATPPTLEDARGGAVAGSA